MEVEEQSAFRIILRINYTVHLACHHPWPEDVPEVAIMSKGLHIIFSHWLLNKLPLDWSNM